MPAIGNDEAAFQEELILVDVNRQQFNETVLVLRDKAGAFYLSGQDMRRWRLKMLDARHAVEHRGETYFSLGAISGVSQVFDPRRSTLMIEAGPDAFVATARAAGYTTIPPPTRSDPGGFFNYDLVLSQGTGSEPQRAGQFELGFFNRYGVGISNLLADKRGGHAGWTRLDSTWTVDMPETLRSLQFGDATSHPGSWGRSVRFGGIRYATNFATQPGFVTFPALHMTGQAVLPSTVDVFVNNALVSRQNVPPGPFSVGNLPIVSGTGEVRLVVRDLLGREQVSTQPFYASPALMRVGLEDFSYEVGRVRKSFGIASNDYGSGFGSATYRRGISENFTAEVHAEALAGRAAAGGGGDYLIPALGTFSGHLATSRRHDQDGSSSGSLLLLGIDRQARPWSIGARAQWTTSGFSQIGQLPQQLPPVLAGTVMLSYAAGTGTSTAFAHLVRHNRDEPDVRITSVSYNMSLGKWASLSLSAVRSRAVAPTTALFAILSIPLDQTTSLSLSAQAVGGNGGASSQDFAATLQRSLPLGEGYGYRLLANSERSAEASVLLQNNVGTYTLGAARSPGTNAARIAASGGVAVLGGDTFASRRIDQSFAVARIPDYPDIPVLADNLPAGRTDANGNALIPRLRAYDRNVISVDQRDLPLDAKIGTLAREVVPYFRSGVDVLFPIEHSRGATMTIHLESGTALPVGATVQIVGKDEIHVVGYDGEVYVVGLAPTNRLRAGWRGQHCEFDAPVKPSLDPLPDLGTFICRGIMP